MHLEKFALLDVLACPNCGGNLQKSGDFLICTCGKHFPIIESIPNIIVDMESQDITQYKAWEKTKVNEKWVSSWLSEQMPPFERNMKDLKNELKDSLVLDLGCGSLFPTAPIKILFKPKNIVALDFSHHMIKTLGDLTLKVLGITDEGIYRVVSDLNTNKLPFKDSVFDFVVGSFILHHIVNPPLILEEIERILRTNGVCWFIEPCKPYIPIFKKRVVEYRGRFDTRSRQESFLRQFDKPRHYVEWKKMFMNHFSIVYIGYPKDLEYAATKILLLERLPVVLRKSLIKIWFLFKIIFDEAFVALISRKITNGKHACVNKLRIK